MEFQTVSDSMAIPVVTHTGQCEEPKCLDSELIGTGNFGVMPAVVSWLPLWIIPTPDACSD